MCYAGLLHQRYSGPGMPHHKGYAKDFDTPEMFPGRMGDIAKLKSLAGHERPDKPWLGKRRRLIFISDMGDALSASIPFEYLFQQIVWNVTSHLGMRHDWQWLTKRPARMAEFSAWLATEKGTKWPSNLWAMTSITDAGSVKRMGLLEGVGDADTTRVLSVEPLEGPVSLELDRHAGIHGVIVGGGSGSLARPCKQEWIEEVVRDCRANDRTVFVKQLGACFDGNRGGRPLVGKRMGRKDVDKLGDDHGQNWDEWPENLRVRQLPERQLSSRFSLEGSAA